MSFKRITPRITRAILLTLTAALVGVPASAAVVTVNCDPAAGASALTINGGIAMATAGDTVLVEQCNVPVPATRYFESVAINGFTGLHLVAAEQAYFGAKVEGLAAPAVPPTVIDGSGLGPCISITNGVDVSVHGFTIENCSGPGVSISAGDHVQVSGNRFVDAQYGVFDLGSFNTRITGNAIAYSMIDGVVLEGTEEAYVHDNIVVRNAQAGIRLLGAHVTKLYNNVVSTNTGTGIVVDSGTGNRLERNTTLANNVSDIWIGGAPAAVGTDVIGNNISGAILDFGFLTDRAANF